MAKQIHQLAGLTGNIASSDVFAVDTGTVTRKYPYGSLAGAIVEQYNGSTIGGKAQTIKAAIDALAGVLSDAEIRKIFTGNVIVAPASGAGEIGGLMIYGKSVQDGTPTPSSPAAITTTGAGGSIGVVSGSKNLIKKFQSPSGTGTGLTYTEDAETGTYTLVSTAGSGQSKYAEKETGVSGVAGATMTLSFASVSGDNLASVRVYQGSNQLAMVYGSTKSVTFTVPTNNELSVVWRIGNDTASGVTVVFKGVQLEFGSTRTDFAPIRDKVVASVTGLNSLPGIPVASGGNYTDTDGQEWICDTIDLEAGTYTKRVEIYTVTGSESISKSSESAVDTYLLYFPTGTPDLVKGNTAFLCSHFMASGTTAVGNAEIPTTGNYLRMRCHYASAGTSTVEAFTAAITGMTVVYALATPEVSQLTQAQITALKALKSFDGGTALFTTDDAQPDLRAKIFVNAGAYI